MILGHGRDEKEDEYSHNMSWYTGAEDILSEIHNMLKKDTGKAICEHIKFFSSLNQKIDCIHSYGFSFGEVDQPYIKKICEILPTENIIWYLNDFDKKQIPLFEKQLRSAGFQGKISTFSIKKLYRMQEILREKWEKRIEKLGQILGKSHGKN